MSWAEGKRIPSDIYIQARFHEKYFHTSPSIHETEKGFRNAELKGKMTALKLLSCLQ